jgi:glucose-6-phosphate isomerase
MTTTNKTCMTCGDVAVEASEGALAVLGTAKGATEAQQQAPKTPQEIAQELIDAQVASRLHEKDASLYDFSESACACASEFMGWVDLASNPPYPIDAIQELADDCVGHGIRTVLLLGQGGSSQAAMTLTKYNKVDSNRVSFKTMDSDSPVRFRQILSECKPQTTLVIVSSKSGSTIEPTEYLVAVRAEFGKVLPEEELVKHLIAITDPGSDLAKQAYEENWRNVLYGEPSVGGRYSALSVFGLLPAALVGIRLDALMEEARIAESMCSANDLDNPAIQLATFLYSNYCQGRDKFSFLTPKRGRVLGLWIEQLVAESLGKDEKGILPNIEVDPLLLRKDPGDRGVIKYVTRNDSLDETVSYAKGLDYIDPAIPQLSYSVESAYDLVHHFIMWEYATAMCGYLMKVCPFDQPNVASAKKQVLEILASGHPKPTFTQCSIDGIKMGRFQVSVSESLCVPPRSRQMLEHAVQELIASIEPGDFFGLLAFLPYTGEGRREALEDIRNDVADKIGVPSCLEVGPRYLHSTGQLHKGGKNNGVFLILSAEEMDDIKLDSRAKSLGTLAKAQAAGDFMALSERGRRCVYINLPDNAGVTLRALERVVKHAAEKAAY